MEGADEYSSKNDQSRGKDEMDGRETRADETASRAEGCCDHVAILQRVALRWWNDTKLGSLSSCPRKCVK